MSPELPQEIWKDRIENEIKGLTSHLLEVVEENTKANAVLAKAIDHLDVSIREYRAKRASE